MLILTNRFSRILTTLANNHRVRWISVNNDGKLYEIAFNYNFSNEEQEKILYTLNHSNPQLLSRYSMTQGRIKSLENWKNKNGPFKNLSDVLEVDGLGERMLKQICDRIVTNDVKEEPVKISSSNAKKIRQILIPQLSDASLSNIKCAVGVHLGPTGISWAKIARQDNQLSSWNYKLFASLPNKMLLNETFDLALNTIQKLPVGDIYIFEANASSPPSQSQSANISSYTHHLELMSMLFALINTSQKHNGLNGEVPKNFENKVYQVKSKVPARLFKTLVGNEKVSALSAISQLVNGNFCPPTVPCSPINVDPPLKQFYNGQSPITKELLSQALMLVISFMDLCVYKNPASIAALTQNKRK